MHQHPSPTSRPQAKPNPAAAAALQEGKPLVLECVRRAERLVLEDPLHHREYLDMGGDRDFCR
jgi:hypothetical protein